MIFAKALEPPCLNQVQYSLRKLYANLAAAQVERSRSSGFELSLINTVRR